MIVCSFQCDIELHSNYCAMTLSLVALSKCHFSSPLWSMFYNIGTPLKLHVFRHVELSNVKWNAGGKSSERVCISCQTKQILCLKLQIAEALLPL